MNTVGDTKDVTAAVLAHLRRQTRTTAWDRTIADMQNQLQSLGREITASKPIEDQVLSLQRAVK